MHRLLSSQKNYPEFEALDEINMNIYLKLIKFVID